MDQKVSSVEDLARRFEKGDAVIGVIGLGYVGVPLALVACSKKEEKSDALSGARTVPTTEPPLALTTLDVSASSAWPNA